MEWLERFASPWSELYSNHTIVAMVVMTFHLLALLVGGGLALSADWTTLGVLRQGVSERARQLEQLARTHRIVIAALVVSFVTGLLLAAADVGVFLASPLFWIKIGVIALLIVNGAALRHFENQIRFDQPSDRRWSRLALTSRVSMSLWIGAVIVGVALTDFAG
jgi:hypothetical protein